MKSKKLTVILHYRSDWENKQTDFRETLRSVMEQDIKPDEIIIIGESSAKSEIGDILDNLTEVKVIEDNNLTKAKALSRATEDFASDYYLYINNTTAFVKLRKSAIYAFVTAAKRNPQCGYIYADYTLEDSSPKDIHLLNHHPGRLRDNQDYGIVHFFTRKALKSYGGFDDSLNYHPLYDMRLKISENFDLVRIANKMNGSLYFVRAHRKGHNVFDYLLAGKESQLEAERIITEHLKRIGAFLPPGSGYHNRPNEDSEYQVSVIIPVNNRPDFIKIAIESVLSQTVQAIECIVVVNGGDSDPTTEAVRSFLPGGINYKPENPPVRLEILDINNIGLSLNRGVEIAKGRYYVQLDSDDRLKPDAIEKILEAFQSDPRIGMVIGSYEVWQKNEQTGENQRVEEIPVVTHDEWTEENGRNNLLRINGAGAPRSIPISVIKEMGYFGINDEPFARNYGEDYDMVLRISERYRIGRIWEPIYEVIRHSGGTDHSIDQTTIDRNDEAKDFMRLNAIKRRMRKNNL